MTTSEVNAKTLDEVDTVYHELADNILANLMLTGLECGLI